MKNQKISQLKALIKKNRIIYRSLKIALIYFLIGVIWIVFSDTITNLITNNPEYIVIVSIIKGVFYVISTAILLFLLIYASFRKQLESEVKLYESERSMSVLLSNLHGMAYRCDYNHDWRLQFVSAGCKELTGYSPDKLLNNSELSFNDIIVYEYREKIWDELANNLPTDRYYRLEYEIMTATGERKWVLELGQSILKPDGEIEALEGIIIDISDRKEQENKLKYFSEHDLLTGLYTRRYFEELLTSDRCDLAGQKRAILMLNLRQLNSLNLAYGYDFCETVIKELAHKLSTLVNEKITLFQISFERYAFYFSSYNDVGELKEFCDVIFELLRQVQIIHALGCGIGIMEISEYKCNSGLILRNTSIAAERAGENQTFSYCIFDKEFEEQINRETIIKQELLNIVHEEGNSRLYLHFQPIIHLGNDRIYGFEALARVYCDNLGYLQPTEFIPIAEELMLIIPIGHEVIRQSCIFIKQLETAGYDDIIVSVNVSALQLLSDEFISDILGEIETSGISAQKLELEITESIFTENYDLINQKLGKLKDMGMKISIDDFGTGYSSLARERELNVNCLKIDKFFIAKINDVNPETSITGDIISMAHKLGHYVIAEGVESELQKQYLITQKCDMMQGFLFSDALEPDAAIDILIKTNTKGV